MLATLTNTQRRTGDLNVASMEYALPRNRQFGRLTARIPRSSVALYRADAVNLDGGSKIVVRHEQLGDWYGVITDPPEFDADGTILVEALQAPAIVQAPDVNTGQEFRYETAGAIVRAALRAALEGNPAIPVIAGKFVEAAPLVPYYKLSRVKLDKVLTDMESVSGQEWNLEPVAGHDWQFRFNWTAPAATVAYDRTFILGTDIAYLGSSRGEGERLARVIGVDKMGRTYTATNPDLATSDPFPAEMTIAIDTTSEVALADETEAIAALHRYPRITHKLRLLKAPPWAVQQSAGTSFPPYGSLEELRRDMAYFAGGIGAYENWRVARPGSIINILCPGERLSGIRAQVRVTKLTYGDKMHAPDIEVEEIRPLDARTIKAAARGLQITPAPIAGSLLALLVLKLNSDAPRGLVSPADIETLAAAQVSGLLSPQQIEKIYGAQVSGAVASAAAASAVPAAGVGAGNLGATVAANPAALQNGAIKPGVTIAGGQVSSPVSDATNAAAVPAAGVAAGSLGAAVAANPNALQAGTIAAGVVVPGANVTGTVPAATTATTATAAQKAALTGSTSYDPPSIGPAGTVTVNVTVTGAAVGDRAVASFSNDLQSISLTAQVNAPNTVTVYFTNHGATVDISPGTLRVDVWAQ